MIPASERPDLLSGPPGTPVHRFRQPVEPGVLLKLEVGFLQKRATVCKFAGRATIDGKVAAEAQFTAMIADPPAA